MIPGKLRGFWNLMDLPCEGMSRLASESLDRDLGPLERFALRLHQSYCRGCQRYGKQLRFLRVATCKLPHALDADATSSPVARSLATHLPDDDRARIKMAIREDARYRSEHPTNEPD